MDVVILAGGPCDSELAAATGATFRHELVWRGRTYAEIVLSAVSHLGEPIVVGGSTGVGYRTVPPGPSFIESVRNGLEAVRTETFFLATVDLPCLTPEAVQDFVDRSDPGAALNYPVIPMSASAAKFPGMKRTTVRLREGEFTGGNVAVMQTGLMLRAMPVLQRAYEARKSPARLAALVGLGTLARLALSRVVPASLGLGGLERAVGKFLGVPVRAIVTPYAEIGADIDTLSQYQALDALKDQL